MEWCFVFCEVPRAFPFGRMFHNLKVPAPCMANQVSCGKKPKTMPASAAPCCFFAQKPSGDMCSEDSKEVSCINNQEFGQKKV